MSLAGSFLRDADTVRKALDETISALASNRACGLAGAAPVMLSEILRNDALLEAQKVYLSSILFQIESGVGSRGGSAVPDPEGFEVHPSLPWKFAKENVRFRKFVLESTDTPDGIAHRWVPCRPIPACDGWFEKIWEAFREKKIYGKEPVQ